MAGKNIMPTSTNTTVVGPVRNLMQGENLYLFGHDRERLFMVPTPSSEVVFGRDALIARTVAALAAAPDGARLVLQGLPGAGKSTVANRIARHPALEKRFAGGVIWAGIGQKPDRKDFLLDCAIAVGEALQVAETASVARRRALIHRRLADRPVLVVIDDVWDVADFLAHILPGRCVYLVTARRPDTATAISPDRTVPVGAIEPAYATAMLRSYAPEVDAYPELTADAIEAAAGLPMKLSLIGGQLAKASIGKDVTRLRQSLERAREFGDQGLEPYIDASVNTLSPTARDALLAFSIFRPEPNDFTKAAARAVAACNDDIIYELLDAGLIEGRRDDIGGGRLSLHAAIASFEFDCLRKKDEARKLPEMRMVEHYAAIAESANGLGRSEARLVFSRDMGNIEAALKLAMKDAQLRVLLARAATSYGEFLRSRGLNHRAEVYSRTAFEVSHLLSDWEAAADACLSYSHLLEKLGTYDKSLAQLSRFDVLAQAPSPTRFARSFYIRAVIAFNRSDYGSAGDYVAAGIRQLAEYASAEGVAFLDPSTKLIFSRHHLARELYCDLLERRCLVWVFCREWKRAADDVKRGRAIARALNDECREAEHLLNASWLKLRAQLPSEAVAPARRGYKLAKAHEHKEYETGFLHRLACIAAASGRPKKARELLDEALRLATDIQHRWYGALIHLELGRLELNQGRPEAWRSLTLAAEIADQLGSAAIAEDAKRFLSPSPSLSPCSISTLELGPAVLPAVVAVPKRTPTQPRRLNEAKSPRQTLRRRDSLRDLNLVPEVDNVEPGPDTSPKKPR